MTQAEMAKYQATITNLCRTFWPLHVKLERKRARHGSIRMSTPQTKRTTLRPNPPLEPTLDAAGNVTAATEMTLMTKIARNETPKGEPQ